MNKKLDLAIGLSLLLSLLLAGVVVAEEPVHWGYEGEHGPEHWGELSSDFAACSEGMEQSPIDIPGSSPVNPADILFNYQPTALNIVNNGHTIKVNYDQGSSMEIDGKQYNLLQFHFHALSEHTIDDQYSDMEMHLVHQSDDGEYAVVGVMMERGGENPAYVPVWDNMPAEEGGPQAIEGVAVNAADLLPAEQSYYRYNGSFTTPPCTEEVKWFLMNTPVELSDAQMAAFEAIYDGNYRPVQPFNDRTFLLTSGVGAAPEELPATGADLMSLIPFGLALAGTASLSGGVAGYVVRRRKSA